MTESEKNKILDLVNNLNIAEYEYNRLDFASDVRNYMNEIMATKYTRYQNFNTKEDFIKYMLEYIKKYYFIE